MNTEFTQQRKIFVGPEGAPTYIGEYHQRYGDEPQQFHSYCSDHGAFGTCGTEEEASKSAKVHLQLQHSELLEGDAITVAQKELHDEFLYRLRTVAALALMRGKHNEKLPEDFIENEAKIAVAALQSKSR